ncbi:reverse transcriptase domain-containing protein [Tanacetum coccineum]|uniref:Reverse transcriptase domain-containing protein n=1 Tax=Tanacetum coccineum TaxID=301880 RepID=A0ABQ5J665_9ASTR
MHIWCERRSIPRSHSQHEGDQGLPRKSGSSSEATITPNTERGSKPKRKAGKSEQIHVQVREKVTPFLQNSKKMLKKERLPMDTRSEKSVPKHEEMYSGTAYGNRTKIQRRADNVPMRSQRGDKHSSFDRKGLATNTNLFHQPCSASPRDKLQSDRKSGFSISARHKKAEKNRVKNLTAKVDSRLVANQINGLYEAKEQSMTQYLEKAKSLIESFKIFSIEQVPQSENKKVDALSKIASTSFAYLTKQVLVETLKRKCTKVYQAGNDEGLLLNLDILEERRERAAVREARTKSWMEKYYNAKACNISFCSGDFFYRSNEASRAKESEKLVPKWEGPYEVIEALRKGAYKLRNGSGDILLRKWNVQDLKKCYL